MIGVIGGYGYVGARVAAELRRRGAGPLLIGGRNPARAEAMCAALGDAVPVAVDLADRASVDALCSRCAVVINAGSGFSPVLLASVLAHRCHVIELDGFTPPRDDDAHAELVRREVAWVHDASLMPGVPELVELHLAQRSGSTSAIELRCFISLDAGTEGHRSLARGLLARRDGGPPAPHWKLQKLAFPAPLGTGRFFVRPYPGSALRTPPPRSRMVAALDWAPMMRSMVTAIRARGKDAEWIAEHLFHATSRRFLRKRGELFVLAGEARDRDGAIKLRVELVAPGAACARLYGIGPAVIARRLLAGPSPIAGICTMTDVVDAAVLIGEYADVGLTLADC